MPIRDLKHISILERFGPQKKHVQDSLGVPAVVMPDTTEWPVFPSQRDRDSIPASWTKKGDAEESNIPTFTPSIFKGKIK
jgi:hypothetical protein